MIEDSIAIATCIKVSYSGLRLPGLPLDLHAGTNLVILLAILHSLFPNYVCMPTPQISFVIGRTIYFRVTEKLANIAFNIDRRFAPTFRDGHHNDTYTFFFLFEL